MVEESNVLIYFLVLDKEQHSYHDSNSFEDDEDFDDGTEDGSGSGDRPTHESSYHEEGSGDNANTMNNEKEIRSR